MTSQTTNLQLLKLKKRKLLKDIVRKENIPVKIAFINEEEKEHFNNLKKQALSFNQRYDVIDKKISFEIGKALVFVKLIKPFSEQIKNSFYTGMLSPNELNSLSRELRQFYFNTFNSPELHAFYITSEMHDYKKDLHPTKLNLERFFNGLKEKIRIEREGLAKKNKQLKPLFKLENTIQFKTTSTAPRNPFDLGGNVVPPEGGLLGKVGSVSVKIVDTKFRQRVSLLDIPPRPKAQLASRQPCSGVGLQTYMKKHNLKNPVEFAKAYKKHKDYNVKGFINLRMLCDDMNVTVEEALLYICEGMTRSNERWTNHRMNKEFHFRDSQSIVNIVQYYKEQVNKTSQDKTKLKYTIKTLWKSEYVTKIFADYGCTTGTYSTFSRWFNKYKKEVEKLKLA